MSAVDLEATVLSDLDFTPTLPCEHSEHVTRHHLGGPAEWIVIRPSPSACCGAPRPRYLICDVGRAAFLRYRSVKCSACGTSKPLELAFVAFLPIGGDQ